MSCNYFLFFLKNKNKYYYFRKLPQKKGKNINTKFSYFEKKEVKNIF